MGVWVLVVAAVVVADAEQTLVRAEQQLKTLDYRSAAESFEQVCVVAACSRPQYLRAAYGLAAAAASQGQGTRAVSAFKLLLYVDPEWKLPPGASPRVREPFEQATAFMRLRARPELVAQGTLDREQAATVSATLSCDPLSVVERLVLVVRDTVIDASARVPGNDGGLRVTFTLAAGALAGATEVHVEARSRAGGVLLRSAPLEVRSPVVAAPPPVAAKKQRALLLASAHGLLDAPNLALGAEVKVGVAALPFLDAWVGALLGRYPGLRVQVSLHFVRTSVLEAFVAPRFALHPLPTSVGVGGGLALGLTAELGPGRVSLSVVGELLAAPGFTPWVLGPSLGYELDVPGLLID